MVYFRDFFCRFLLLSLLVGFCLWLPGAYRRTTHGFRLSKCQLQWPFISAWETKALSSEEEIGIHLILQEPFRYFSKGAQAYVFISKDEKYVLKLFRLSRSKLSLGKKLQYMMKKIRTGRIIYKPSLQEGVETTFQSYKLAYDMAKDLTGLVYLHLNPRKGNLPMITVQDRLGRKSWVDPSKVRFILQKKAEPFTSSLFQGKKEGVIQPMIESYLSLIRQLSQLGLSNQDCAMKRNFAFLNGRAMAIDAGSYVYNPEEAKKDTKSFSLRMRSWLERHIPEACIFVDLYNPEPSSSYK